ncbi:MAG: hypothetical protein ACTSWX_06800 [Promethearchaeota archaeon]
MNNSISDSQKYRRFPAKRVFIKDLHEGQWLSDDKKVASRYGNLKTVRVCGTVTKKYEKSVEENKDSIISENIAENTRIFFQIDDGTGRLNGTIWGVNLEDYSDINYGTLVEMVGNTRWFKDQVNLTLKFIRKIRNPNYELYHILEVLRKRKFEPKYEIKKETSLNYEEFDFESDNNEESADLEEYLSNEIEDNDKIENDNVLNQLDDKKNSNSEIFKGLDQIDEIINYIRENDKGNGVSFEDIAKKFSINSDELKLIIDQLCQDVNIYKVNPGHYSLY